MRVMHVIAPAPFGGAESVVRALAQGRAASETSVAALVSDHEHPFVDGLRASGVAVEAIATRPRRYFEQSRRVSDRITALGVDVLHTHVYHADFVGYLAARRTRRPVVATIHGYIGGSLRGSLYEWADRRLLRRFDAVIAVSRGNRDRLVAAGCPPEKIHLVPNGVASPDQLSRAEARASLALPLDGPVIGWVGRMSQEKGPDLLLQAVESLGRPDVATVLIGDGPVLGEIERRVASTPTLRGVRIAGSRADASRLYAAFDVLAISSRTEGLPMVMLEAVGAGTPVVGFAVGGVGDQLTNDTAWLVSQGDVRGLGKNLGEALGMPAERKKRAAAARTALSGRLGHAEWVKGVERVYSAVVKTPGNESHQQA